jgi:hypothetical protein
LIGSNGSRWRADVDIAREIANTPQYKQSRRDRKKVEMLFAQLKRILELDRLRLRGLTGAADEFLLAATPQNLRRMAKRLYSRLDANAQARQSQRSAAPCEANVPHGAPQSRKP